LHLNFAGNEVRNCTTHLVERYFYKLEGFIQNWIICNSPTNYLWSMASAEKNLKEKGIFFWKFRLEVWGKAPSCWRQECPGDKAPSTGKFVWFFHKNNAFLNLLYWIFWITEIRVGKNLGLKTPVHLGFIVCFRGFKFFLGILTWLHIILFHKVVWNIFKCWVGALYLLPITRTGSLAPYRLFPATCLELKVWYSGKFCHALTYCNTRSIVEFSRMNIKVPAALLL